ncbi:MAG: FeoA domain-containing protein [Caldilineales bacterium]|nr:FeoA domain-containing protein [Caldilineales bacterium]
MTSLLLLIGLILALMLVALWPQRGLWWQWQRHRRFGERIRTEDALKHIHTGEMEGLRPTAATLAEAMNLSAEETARLLGRMEAAGLLTRHPDGLSLTPQGRTSALHIIRAHRLWERYLADQTGYEANEWHRRADISEHRLGPEDTATLAAQLGNPTYDPHGDPIPDADGRFVGHGGRPLTELAAGRTGRIVHIEDEPQVVYAQLLAEGIAPGQDVRVLEQNPERVRFWANGDEHVLAPALAANIAAIPLAEPPSLAAMTLAALKPGQSGVVVRLSPQCRGPDRRRLLDLGILPGTVITAEMVSPSGDPTAYRVRGALIALRREQARLIYIRPSSAAAAGDGTSTAAVDTTASQTEWQETP